MRILIQKCDRCGKETKYSKEVKNTYPNIKLEILAEPYKEAMRLDLCEDCQKAIYEFVYEKGK